MTDGRHDRAEIFGCQHHASPESDASITPHLNRIFIHRQFLAEIIKYAAKTLFQKHNPLGFVPVDLTALAGALGLWQKFAPEALQSGMTPDVPRMGKEVPVYSVLTCSFSCLAIATLYYLWRDLYLPRMKRHLLRERVAYMLWIAAQRIR